ncbi:M56 family metallopeptidase [bacterium]|nr:M56 family metallopeptidase [bacterium]
MNSACIEQHIWNGCLQGTVALLLAYGICRLLPKMQPNAMSWIWRLAYLKLMVAFIFVGSICLPVLNRPYSRPVSAAVNSVLSPSNIRTLNMKAVHSGQAQNMANILVLVWWTGVTLSTMKILAALRRAKRLRQGCENIDDADLQIELEQLCLQMRIKHVPRLLTGDIRSPMICGALKPDIILPNKALATSSRNDLRMILTHELAHVKRYDVIWIWLPIVAQVFFFFHPLVWLFRREWLFTQESACDQLAMQTTGSPCTDYGRMLLGYVTRRTTTAEPVGIGIAEPYETLQRRINAMTKFAPITGKKKIAVWIGICTLALIGIVPWMLSAKDHKLTSAEIADVLAKAVYNKDLRTIHRICPANKNALSHDPAWNYISQKLQSYGRVKDVKLEAKGKILPGLTGKGFSTGPQFVPAADTEVSTWRVKAENGEYRIGLGVQDGKLKFYEFNLADGGIGGGGL